MPGWLRVLTIFGLQTGARRGEMLQLTWEAVHPHAVEFCETKSGNKRTVQLSSVARMILHTARPLNARPGDFVFEPAVPRKTLVSRVRREWNRAWKCAGIPKIRVHDLRHTALTRLVLTGADIRTVKDIAGHSLLKTTQRYLHSSDRLKQQAVERLSSDFGRYISTALEVGMEESDVSGTIQ